MAITISRGYAASAGETWTPTKQNNSTVPTITCATGVLIGRTTAGTGALEEITVSTGLTFAAGVLALATALNPTSIGASTPGTGAFTTLSATGDVTLSGVAGTGGHGYITGPSAAGKLLTLNAGNTTGGINFRNSLGAEVASYYEGSDLWTFSKPVAVTGTLSATGAISTSATDVVWAAPGGGTDRKFGYLSNSGVTGYWGIEGSAGGSILGGTTAYAMVFGTATSLPLEFGVNNTKNMSLTTTGLAVTGVGSFTGNLSSTGILTLGSGPTTVSDSAGKILSAALNTVAVAQGGTGATTASAARTALGVAIGSDVQAYSSVLTTYAGITPSANVQTLLGSADFAACRSNLGLVIGTNVQAYDADLSALAALSGTNTIYYRSASNTWSAVTIGSNLTFSGGTLSASGGGGGTIGGSTGSTDNRLLRADGTGGATIQASGITLDDSDNLTGVTTIDVGTGGYKVSGTKVVGAQGSAITDSSVTSFILGSDLLDQTNVQTNFADLEGRVNAILARMRAHGLIAT